MSKSDEDIFLELYNMDNYDRPSVTVDVTVFTILSDESENYKRDSNQKLSLLLIKRGEHPFKDKWAIPGGFLRKDETIEQCAMREITEETNITPSAIMPVGVFSKTDRDPRGRIISNAFVSVVSEETLKAVGGADAVDAQWFDFDFLYKSDFLYLDMKSSDTEIHAVLREKSVRFGIPEFEVIDSGGLPFDHAEIIACSLSKLRSVIDDFEIIFDFLPEKFTIANLQKVQEAILNISLLPANFRRKAMAYIEETDEYVTGAGHRPAQLYKRKLK